MEVEPKKALILGGWDEDAKMGVEKTLLNSNLLVPKSHYSISIYVCSFSLNV